MQNWKTLSFNSLPTSVYWVTVFMFVSFRVCFALEERVQTTWIQNCKTKIGKKTWIIKSQNLYLFLLEKCYLSLILPFLENARNKFQCYYFSVGCILNKLIAFSISQGPLLISDYQAKKKNFFYDSIISLLLQSNKQNSHWKHPRLLIQTKGKVNIWQPLNTPTPAFFKALLRETCT